MSFKSSTKAAFVSLAMLAGAATSANSAMITLDKEGTSVWGSPVLARNVSYTIDGTARYHGAGQFQLKDVSTSEAILAFCIDIFQVLKLQHTYDTTPFLSDGVLSQINSLYSNFYADVDTADEAAGFQLALWEISTEVSSTLDLGTGRFITTGTGAQYDIAESYLSGLGDNGDTVWDITTYFSDTSQDVVSGKFVRIAAVPVPFAGLLLMTGFAGLGMTRRRK